MASYIDSDTGEIFENATLITKEQKEARKRYFENNEQVECFKYLTRKEQFVMYLFNIHKSMTDLSPQTAIRLVYLSTFLEYDGEFLKVNGKYITREQMQNLMVLKPTTFKKFLSEVVSAGYLIKEKKLYKLNTKHFYRGELSLIPSDKKQRYVRVYINNLRKLYLSVPQNKHIYLGYIFQLIPYINREWNVICYNPEETDEDAIIPMSVGDFCELVGYNRTNAARFIKEYRDIKFDWNGCNQSFLGYFYNYEDDKADMRFFANPNIFFAGNDYNRVKILKIAFTQKKNNIEPSSESDYFVDDFDCPDRWDLY